MINDYFSWILFSVIRLDYLGCFNVQQFYKAIIDEASVFGNKSIVCYNSRTKMLQSKMLYVSLIRYELHQK